MVKLHYTTNKRRSVAAFIVLGNEDNTGLVWPYCNAHEMMRSRDFREVDIRHHINDNSLYVEVLAKPEAPLAIEDVINLLMARVTEYELHENL